MNSDSNAKYYTYVFSSKTYEDSKLSIDQSVILKLIQVNKASFIVEVINKSSYLYGDLAGLIFMLDRIGNIVSTYHDILSLLTGSVMGLLLTLELWG